MENISFEAQMLHSSYERPDVNKALAMPVYHSVACEFDTAEDMEEAFCGRAAVHFYSRITNPTVQYFEKRVREATGAYSVTALNSGMAAISNTFMCCASAGANVVLSPHLFGNTYVLFKTTMASFGVEPRFCNMSDPEQLRSRIDGNTCAVFLEIISNPQMEVADLKALSSICKEAGVPLVVDTTLIPFSAFRAADFGVDIELVSSTKYISGGATGLGGLIIDYGTFDWSNSRSLKAWNGPKGNEGFTARLRREICRNMGAYMTPQTAYMQTLGLETLSIRYNRQSRTCLELAKRLQKLDGIVSVNYNGLPDNPYHAVSSAQFGECPGAMLTFDLVSREACFSLINRVKMIRRATNLFDNRSLIIHPASTIYGSFSEDLRRSMDVSQLAVRLSVGLESVDDLFSDLSQALS